MFKFFAALALGDVGGNGSWSHVDGFGWIACGVVVALFVFAIVHTFKRPGGGQR